MGDGSHIFNVRDLQAAAVQCADSRFTARAGAHDANFDVLYAMFLGHGSINILVSGLPLLKYAGTVASRSLHGTSNTAQ